MVRETELSRAIREHRERELHQATDRLRIDRRPGRKQCTHCRQYFIPKFANAKLCRECFIKRERALAEYDDMQARILSLEAKLAHLSMSCNFDKSADAPDSRTLKWMMQQCHPDRSQGGQVAEDAVKFLNRFNRRG